MHSPRPATEGVERREGIQRAIQMCKSWNFFPSSVLLCWSNVLVPCDTRCKVKQKQQSGRKMGEGGGRIHPKVPPWSLNRCRCYKIAMKYKLYVQTLFAWNRMLALARKLLQSWLIQKINNNPVGDTKCMPVWGRRTSRGMQKVK